MSAFGELVGLGAFEERLVRRARLNLTMPRALGTCEHCKRSGVLVRGVHPEAREDFDTDATRLCVDAIECSDAFERRDVAALRDVFGCRAKTGGAP